MFDLYVGSHFVVDCAFYDDLREKFKNVLMKEGIEFEEERKTEAGKKRLMQHFSEPDYKERTRRRQPCKLRQETLNFCRGAMCRRRAVVNFAAGPKNLKRYFLALLLL